MSYPVGAVAQPAGVTVRTLHHYDEIGLLRPSGRSPAGYRRYADPDLERLRQILCYRELGFPLEEIATILAEPTADPLAHLRRQHTLLRERVGRLKKMINAIELMMEAHQMGSGGGSTTARTRLTGVWPRCTSPTLGSPRTSTSSGPDSPRTCGRRSSPTPPAARLHHGRLVGGGRDEPS